MTYGANRIRYGTLAFIKGERQQIVYDFDKKSASGYSKSQKKKKHWRIIHPYLGFVTEGIDDNRKCEKPGFCDQRLRTYEDSPFIKSTEDNLIVAIIGGSFAAGVSYGSGDGVVQQYIKRIPRFSDKEIILYHLAPGGYKQPQQLLKINYFLSLGAEFDLIINIDGFNEIVLPGVENLTKGVHPSFPRSWYYLVDAALNKELMAMYGKREHYRLQQFNWANFFSKPALNSLPSTNLIWKYWNLKLNNKIKMTDVELVEYHEDEDRKLQYVTTGPDYQFTSWEDYYQDMAELWARSSLQLHALCRGLGIEYFHFLQPNQYVKDSKPMSEKEKEVALLSRSKYGKAAGEGYPYLIKEGQRLREKGVAFYDLTMIFSDISKQYYVDNCCHLNGPGYLFVVKEIARHIEESTEINK